MTEKVPIIADFMVWFSILEGTIKGLGQYVCPRPFPFYRIVPD